MAYDSFCFAHAGFRLSGFWQEVGDPKRARMLEELGLVRHRQMTMEDGTEQFLLKYTSERALANPAYSMSLVFNCPPPLFGFSRPQQELLESALLDLPDRDFAVSQCLSDDAVKKRWRTIYDRVALVCPQLVGTEISGPNQRRLLLGYFASILRNCALTSVPINVIHKGRRYTADAAWLTFAGCPMPTASRPSKSSCMASRPISRPVEPEARRRCRQRWLPASHGRPRSQW